MSKAPKIGITMRLEIGSRRFYLGRDYAEAIAGCGGVPIQIPLIHSESVINDIVAGLDGLLLPGSDSDVDPAFYGEQPSPQLGAVIPEKDITDRLALAEADRHRIPILGICYGMQALNVYRGGSLIQDIATAVEDPLRHQQGIPRETNTHSIRVEPAGRLRQIVDLADIESETRVNSHHHQAVQGVGNGLTVTARAYDGVIECIEGSDVERFELGVQWHPELSWNSDPVSSGIFRSFLDAAAAFREQRTVSGS